MRPLKIFGLYPSLLSPFPSSCIIIIVYLK
nr:MAG TPA: hypothetical protein [Caudoviricetes sp.]